MCNFDNPSMVKRQPTLLVLFFLVFASVAAFQVNAAPIFSVDPASPVIDGNITPDDILSSGPLIDFQGTDLGLLDDFFGGLFDNLNALSFGVDPISGALVFSVDRVAIGAPGSDVRTEAMPGSEEASGDTFVASPPIGTNRQLQDEQQLGLTPGFFGDDLNALSLRGSASPWVYFSIDDLSFSAVSSADILVSDGSGSFNLFAVAADIGLDSSDDIDGLMLMDVDGDGVLNPGLDMALFSLNTFSPSAYTFTGNSYAPGVAGRLSPADVLFTDFTGSFSLFASAADLGLLPDDELDALSANSVPEPPLATALILGLLVLLRSSQHRC